MFNGIDIEKVALETENTPEKTCFKRRGAQPHDVYWKKEHLGDGNFGNVFLVLDPQGRKYAAKLLKIPVYEKHQGLANKYVRGECAMLMRLKDKPHPNIVNIHDILDPMTYIFEYCDGGTLLGHFASQKIIGEGEIKKIFAQMLSAVDFLYCNGIAHRDIKPPNVLVVVKDGKYTFKLADFGFSKTVDSIEKMSTKLGSVLFNSSLPVKKFLEGFEKSVKSLADNVKEIGSFNLNQILVGDPTCQQFIKSSEKIKNIHSKLFHGLNRDLAVYYQHLHRLLKSFGSLDSTRDGNWLEAGQLVEEIGKISSYFAIYKQERMRRAEFNKTLLQLQEQSFIEMHVLVHKEIKHRKRFDLIIPPKHFVPIHFTEDPLFSTFKLQLSESSSTLSEPSEIVDDLEFNADTIIKQVADLKVNLLPFQDILKQSFVISSFVVDMGSIENNPTEIYLRKDDTPTEICLKKSVGKEEEEKNVHIDGAEDDNKEQREKENVLQGK
eukprot:gene4105-4792_t